MTDLMKTFTAPVMNECVNNGRMLSLHDIKIAVDQGKRTKLVQISEKCYGNN